MKELDIDGLMKVMDSDKVGGNADSIMNLLKNANKFMTQLEQLVEKMDKMGLKPLFVRGAGAKLGIDAETPLQTDGILGKSPQHKALFEHLNTLTVEQLEKMFKEREVIDGTDDKSTVDKD